MEVTPMGLDTSHDCWHGAYSAFGHWRRAIAEAAGYRVWPVVHESGLKYDTIMLEWHRYGADKELMGEWDSTPHDPLIVLFAHSDCEGVIHPAQALPLADALEAILPKIDGDSGSGHIAARGGLRACTEKFIVGLRAAGAAGEDVDFH
jgi:hypothetical protein